MRVILEIENDKELKMLAGIFEKIKPTSIKAKFKNKRSKMQDLVAFAEKHSFKVKKIDIPPREQRNAR